MKRTTIAIGAFLVFGLLAGSYANSLYSAPDRSTEEIKVGNSNNSEENKRPPTKIPAISVNANPLLRALLERIWVTKYFGAPAEIYKFSSDMPLCTSLPDSSPKQHTKNGVYLWQHKCLPIEIKWEVNKKDLSGTGTLRILNFDKADEVLEAAFEIIRANSLGIYKIETSKKDAIKEVIKKRSYDSKFPINYKYKLKTYTTLEGRYFLEEAFIGGADVTNETEEIRGFFAHRAKKYALTIEYAPAEFTKKENIIEYTLKFPAGYFGMEEDYQEGKTP